MDRNAILLSLKDTEIALLRKRADLQEGKCAKCGMSDDDMEDDDMEDDDYGDEDDDAAYYDDGEDDGDDD
jgi:hypothetical protein